MHFRHMTPHQFEAVREYVDTLVVSAFTPAPLDIAVPYAASEWIGRQLVQSTVARFQGRVTTLHAGTVMTKGFLGEEWLQSLVQDWMHPVRFATVITDRTLLCEERTMFIGGVHWVIFDWWQWLRSRVPQQRLCDAFMYLCHTCSEYWESPERKLLGIDSAVAESMKEEGSRLLEALTEALSDRLMIAWTETS